MFGKLFGRKKQPSLEGDVGSISIPPQFADDLRQAEEGASRYRQTDDLNALNAAIAAWERILNHPTFAHSEDRFRLAVLNSAGGIYLRRYKRLEDTSDLDAALQLWRQAVAGTPQGHPDLPIRLTNLGTGLYERYNRAGRIEDLEKAMEVYREVLEVASPDHPNWPIYLTNLGNVLRYRYNRTGRMEDLEKALEIYREVLDATPQGHPGLHGYLNNLGNVLRDRYNRTGRMEDLEEALGVYRRAVMVTPPEHRNLPGYLTNLGNVLRDRYSRTERMEDLEEAIAKFRQALETMPEGHPDLPRYLSNLGNGLRDRYNRTGRIEDLEEAIEKFHQAVEKTPEGRPDLPGYLINLSNGLSDRYNRTGRMEDLEEALRVSRQAVAATPTGHPNLPTYLSNLSIGLSDRYRRTGRIEDLEEAIAQYRQAVATTPTGHPDLPARLNNLGNGLRERYRRTGRIEDLEEALKVTRQAVAATPQGHPNLPRYLNNLGNGLRERYRRTGRIEDLEEAIVQYRQMLAATSQDHPELPSRLNNLGNGLRERYHRTGRMEDLKEALKVSRQAVAGTPQGHPDLPTRLNNLGLGLAAQYSSTEQQEYLEEAIEKFRQAVAATPPDHPDLPTRLTNLGTVLHNRYSHTDRLEYLEEAIEKFHQAVAITPPDHPDLPSYLNNLGTGLRDRYSRTGRLEDLEAGWKAYREAWELGLEINQSESLIAARNALTWAFERSEWEETLVDYRAVQAAQKRLMANQFRREDKTFTLGETRGLAARAAWAARQLGDLPQAVEILEAGRAQLLREALERQRSDLHALAGGKDDAFYRAYVQALDTVEDLQALTYEQRLDDWGAQLNRAQEDLQAAIQTIRDNVPRLRYFLRPLPFSEILRQAADAPLVYLAATKYGGFALLISQTSGVHSVDLPALTVNALREQVQSDYLRAYMRWRDDVTAYQTWVTALEDMLAWLGEVVMGPLVNALQERNVAEGSLVRLVPSDWLGLLPLHAAELHEGDPQERKKYALDRYTFTYAPSAQSLYHVREAAQRPADSLLAVRYPDRSFQLADQAVRAALDAFPADKRTPLLMEAATLEAVRQTFDDHAVLFFFTHGFADFNHPLNSGLLTADNKHLTLREILNLRSAKARLAVLSACETGVPSDLKNTDEVISLPSGMMQAGVPGVIGSLWSVAEASTAILISIFFEEWRANGLTPPQALRRAQQILRNARHDDDARRYFARYLMPKDVANDLQQELYLENFAHPFYWAAFTYTGF